MQKLNNRQKEFAEEFALTLMSDGWKEAREKAKELYSDKQFYRLMKNEKFNRYLYEKIRAYSKEN